MNGELHTLFWYTRAELVLLRRKIVTSLNQQCVDSTSSNPEVTRGNEFDNIMCCIIQTLDDILETESLLWNTLFLSHIIQSLTVHLSNLRAQDSATVQTISHLPLDVDRVRIDCFVETLVAICRANLVALCTNPNPSKSSVPVFDNVTLKGNVLVSPTYQNRHSFVQKSRTPNLKIKTPSNSFSNLQNTTVKSPVSKAAHQTACTFTVPTASRVRTKDPLVHSHSNKDMSLSIIEDKIDQVKSLATRVCSKDIVQSHDTAIEAMSNSVHDTWAGLPVHNAESKKNYATERYNDTSRSTTRWHAVNNVIRMIQLPKRIGS